VEPQFAIHAATRACQTNMKVHHVVLLIEYVLLAQVQAIAMV
jgi:hypothetical protein